MRTRFPQNPFRQALGIEIEVPRPGDCVATMPPRGAACDPGGGISQGALATLCDISMGHAIGGQLTERAPFATVHLQIAFHHAAGKEPLRGEGESSLLPSGWKEARAACRVLRLDGAICATAQGFFARRPDRAGEERSAAAMEAVEAEGAAEQRAADLPALLALRHAADGRRVLDVRPALRNPDNVGHGGALAAALDLAMRDALAARGAGSIALRTLDVRYMLPALPGEVLLEVKIDRKGRSIHFAQATALDASGRAICGAVGIYGPAFSD